MGSPLRRWMHSDKKCRARARSHCMSTRPRAGVLMIARQAGETIEAMSRRASLHDGSLFHGGQCLPSQSP